MRPRAVGPVKNGWNKMRMQRIPLVWILTLFLVLAMSTYFSLFNQSETPTLGRFLDIFGPGSRGTDKANEREEDLIETDGAGEDPNGDGNDSQQTLTMQKFPSCSEDDVDLVPCYSNPTELKCPSSKDMKRCLVHPPIGYKAPMSWPESLESVWLANLQEGKLSERNVEKEITVVGDKITFTSTGMSPSYVDRMVRAILAGGDSTDLLSAGFRTGLDLGLHSAGSFAARMSEKNVVLLGTGDADIHVQLASERGLAAVVAPLGSKRMPFPAGTFDFVHCGECLVKWWEDHASAVAELDRILRPKGLFAWSYGKANGANSESWVQNTRGVFFSRCWKQVAEDEEIMVFQRKKCGKKATPGVPACDKAEVDAVVNTRIVPCVMNMSDPVRPTVKALPAWPSRLSTLPWSLRMAGQSPESFAEDQQAWAGRVGDYWRDVPSNGVHRVMDLNAGWGSFAAALVDKEMWILNVVPPKEAVAAAAISELGLLVIAHSWCGPFLAFPRSYDLLHASGLVSIVWETKGCSLEGLLLEMDRVLRPGGHVIFRDSSFLIKLMDKFLPYIGWTVKKVREAGTESVLFAVKGGLREMPNGEDKSDAVDGINGDGEGGSQGETPSDVEKTPSEDEEKEKESPEQEKPPSEQEQPPPEEEEKPPPEEEEATPSKEEETPAEDKEGSTGGESGVYRLPEDVAARAYETCPSTTVDWVPCHDAAYNDKAQIPRSGYAFLERHCPPQNEIPRCLVPPPHGYQVPVAWPQSREAVWLSNVPHTKLAEYKSDQKWMEVNGDMVTFPGGGTFSKGGAVAYIDKVKSLISKENKDFKAEGVRLVLDIGAGVASFGGVLLDDELITASFAPLDVHDAQVQFALERGIPAYVGALASKKMPYANYAFDMAHCSWCRIEWWADDGASLAEVDRVLRPGAFFVWTSPAAKWDDETNLKWREKMTGLIARLCWTEYDRVDLTVVWQKPVDKQCYTSRNEGTKPDLCPDARIDTDLKRMWDHDFEGCLIPFRRDVQRVDELPKWPQRLTLLPARLAALGVTEEEFNADNAMWKKRVAEYWNWMGVKDTDIRNVMDMNSHWGSFAAALADKPLWVYNTVPTQGVANTLGGLLDRGLLSTAHNWCEPFSTYPRTYDLVHADHILSLVNSMDGCTAEGVLFEMDRILRPKAWVIIRDTASTINGLSAELRGLRWDLVKGEQGVSSSGQVEVVILMRKQFWTLPPDASSVGKFSGDPDLPSVWPKVLAGENDYPECQESYQDWIPCHDAAYIKTLGLKRHNSIHYERHCPPPEELPKCLVPPPAGYKLPIRWPQSRDEVWYANVPHTRLADYKADQKWMVVEGDKVTFPGGGTFSKNGAASYIKQLEEMLQSSDGLKEYGIRTVLDVGCGVASFGGVLLDSDVVTIGFAPPDVHESQVQFALERGIPALVGALGEKKLPYAAQVFDMIHCSWCRIPWGDDEGIRLTEIDRVLRPGGVFIWTSPASSWDDPKDAEWRKSMLDAAEHLCWTQKPRDSLTIIWEKPRDSECYEKRSEGTHPPMCDMSDPDNDPNHVWGVNMANCIIPILAPIDRARVEPHWPGRLTKVPGRLAAADVTQEDFDKDTAMWAARVKEYVELTEKEKPFEGVRNVMDMNAGWGGFAAALVSEPQWVLNVVPNAGTKNTVGTILDRGLMGILHDWCEPFSTYPRTYDMLHANMVARMIEKRGCSHERLLLEMDRILRPRGWAIFRDEQSIIESIKVKSSAMRWEIVKTKIAGVLEGGTNEVILIVRKRYWVPPGHDSDGDSSQGSSSGALKQLLPGYERFDVAEPAPVFKVCENTTPDWVPCHDREYNDRVHIPHSGYEYLERHCPKAADLPVCLVPPPKGYKVSIPWPQSRDEVWLVNVPHTSLATVKADQKWMTVEGDKVNFPGGGTFFKGGAEKYLEIVGKLVTDQEGSKVKDANVRLVLDIGCGVASFGGFLLDQDIISASFAPPDNHEAQVQFALERGIPAIIGSLASKRMPYPSSTFELVHCSWCRIDWAANDAALILEVDRVLRPGGFFVWTSPAAAGDDEMDKEWRDKMMSVTPKICWNQVSSERITIVWQKPTTEDCYKSRGEVNPPICEIDNPVTSPDKTWEKDITACLLPFAEDQEPVAKLPRWPERLTTLPKRLAETGTDQTKFDKDLEKWKKKVEDYWAWLGDDAKNVRNVMDMNAKLGSFAAALYLLEKPVWVMNVVPSGGVQPTLPGIVDRGLLGLSHDWCQSFSTYPRTYDMLHAYNLVNLVKLRGCSVEGVLVEMDRMLRPHGWAIFHDETEIARLISSFLPALKWDIVVSAQYGKKNDVLLMARKRLWTPGGAADEDAYVAEGSTASSASSGGSSGGETYTDLSLEDSDRRKLEACEDSRVDYVPCHDNEYAKKIGVPNTGYEFLERHCPKQDEIERCLVPPPPGYQTPIKWPNSKDEVWRSNVPHTQLAEYKSNQKWMEVEDDKVVFPGGGTFGASGAKGYLEKVTNLLLGEEGAKLKSAGVRLSLDIGCGVASFGAALLEEDILAASFAPTDVHDAQVQFALERGLPATIGALATQKLLYPSGVFEMAHCSWCRIDWSADEGALLLEIDRVLRPGAYFVWTSPAVLETANAKDHADWFEKMAQLTPRMCWTEVGRKDRTIVWRKPVGASCSKTLSTGESVPQCDEDVRVWHSKMTPCSSDMQGIPTVSQIPAWPKRLSALPTRLAGFGTSETEFEADTGMWKERVKAYWGWMGVESSDVRNVLDMNAKWGGFAAALELLEKPVWVMNTVPPSKSEELKAVLDRGLLGMFHSWVESFSTYPRTYDVLHAAGLFSMLRGEEGCSNEGVMLEMDRILRPQGWAIIVDQTSLVKELAAIAGSYRWTVVKAVQVGDENAIIICRKQAWSSSS